jgi:translation initiation factor IF-1
MGVNKFGGKKQKSKKNHNPTFSSVKLCDIIPDDITKFIGKITKNLGCYRLLVETSNATHNALIPGSSKNKIWYNVDDFVLLQINSELSTNNCYIIYKYEKKDLDELEKNNLLGSFKLYNSNSENDDNIVFSNIKKEPNIITTNNIIISDTNIENNIIESDDVNIDEI